MIARIVAWSSRHHFVVIAVALAFAIAGEFGRRALARDVVPDLSDPQIVLIADWMGHPAAEVANEVTKVLTSALDGISGSTSVRGSSMAGMAYVDVVFDGSSSLMEARKAVLERALAARPKLPPNVRLEVGPATKSTGWVFQYALVDPFRRESLLHLRHFQDDVLRPALAAIPGVAEVASVGGEIQEVAVEAQPNQLRAKGVAFSDVVASLCPLLDEHKVASVEAIDAVSLRGPSSPGGAVRIGDVARVRVTDDMPTGLADLGGGFQAVGGIVVALPQADLASVIGEAKRVLERERARLPPEIQVITTYDRADLVNRVERTLFRALAEEVGVVVLVILVFLLHGRSALVPLMTLPVVLLLTFGAMWMLGVPATIMSLGGIGIALGMAVDADVVALEACHRRIESGRLEPGEDSSTAPHRALRREGLLRAAGSFAPAILTSLVITALTFLPVFAFTGETGRLLRPLALTKTLVIASAALVALTLGPALRDRLLQGRVRPEFDNPLTRGLVRLYRPFVHFALRRPVLTLATAGLAVVSCLPIMTRLGAEFLPRVDEGDLLFMPTTLPGAPPDQAVMQLRRQDRAIGQFKEVATVFGKVGRADTATDPAPYSMAETTVRLLPRSEWPKSYRSRWYSAWAPAFLKKGLGLVWPEEGPITMPELIDRLDRASRMPGWTSAWTAPARARMDMMSTGIRTPVGIRIVASETARLDALGTRLSAMAARVSGTRSAVFESLGGEPWLHFDADLGAVAANQVDPALVESTAALVIDGGQIGEIAIDGHRMRVRVLADVSETMRGRTDQLRKTTVRSSGPVGTPVPMAMLGRPRFISNPAAVRTERGELVAYVYVDLAEGTDLLGYVDEAKKELARAVEAKEITLLPGERIEWAGQYDLLASGERRLKWIVPAVAMSMLALLFLQFRSLTEALIVLASVPFALVGSVWTLFLLGYPLSAPVWVGLLSVVGLAMQTGVVMVVYIDEAFHRRVREGRLRSRDDIVAAHAEGTVQRLRPKIMTVTTMAAGLLPLLWTEGAGAEIMKRVAAPMIGGLATSAFLTLEVIPVLYTIWRTHQLRRAERTGEPIEKVVGDVPAWARR